MKYNFEKGGLQPGAPIPTQAEWDERAKWFEFFKNSAAERLQQATDAIRSEDWAAFEEAIRYAKHDIAAIKRRRKRGN